MKHIIMNNKIFSRRHIFMLAAFFLILILAVCIGTFLYISHSFRTQPKVTVHADNIYNETLHVVTDIDYEPFSYVDKDGEYLGLDVELIAEIANRLHMNLDLKLLDWPSVNELFFTGQADAILNMETDSVAHDTRMTATLPTAEKQYVVYGRETVSSVPELYGRKVASLHALPELGLGDGITYVNSYAKIFEALKNGEYDFAICPIQVGNVFLEKLDIHDIKASYAVGHIYGAIALKAGNFELKRKLDTVISELQKEGRIDELDKKWVSHRYQILTLRGIIENYPEVPAIFLAVVFLVILLLVYLEFQGKRMRDKDFHSRELEAKNEELFEAKKKAEESSQAKSAFLSNMSHEIRTPINAVLGMNEMIIREASQDGNLTQIKTYAGNVERAGKNLLSIINDILDFSKIDAGKMEVVSTHYKLSSILNDVANMIMFRAKEKELEFYVEADEKLPDGLLGDEVRIRQILTNVLSNAVKYTSEGSIHFSISGKKSSASDDEELLTFSIKDTGMGIKPEDISKLFQKFARVDLTRNKTIEGTGLGLAITKNLLELMNGDIKVESEYGKGSTFTVTIPQKVISWEPIGNFREKFERAMLEKATYQESFQAPDAKILVVDDTVMNLTVVTGLLAKTKIQIDTASGGEEALRRTKQEKYDLIFMDQMMPIMDGTETLNKIRVQDNGLNNDTPVLCLTADAISGAREKYLEQGFIDYLSKPIEGVQLEAALRKYLPQEKVIVVHSEDTAEAQESSELRKLYDGIDTLNYSEAVKFCSSEEILDKTLRVFYETITANSDSIEKFLREEDYRNYTIKVHALKSSARLIGAESLSSEAAYLEDCGNNLTDESVAAITERTPKLLADYRSYKEKLSPLYGVNEDLPEIAQDELEEVYSAIKEFAYSFDIDAIDNILNEARKYKIPDTEAKRFEAVKTAARNMDWDALDKALTE